MHLAFGCICVQNLLIGKEKFLLLCSLLGRRANGLYFAATCAKR